MFKSNHYATGKTYSLDKGDLRDGQMCKTIIFEWSFYTGRTNNSIQ